MESSKQAIVAPKLASGRNSYQINRAAVEILIIKFGYSVASCCLSDPKDSRTTQLSHSKLILDFTAWYDPSVYLVGQQYIKGALQNGN